MRQYENLLCAERAVKVERRRSLDELETFERS